jgi:glycerol-3-phosphate acyltransferase PlsY
MNHDPLILFLAFPAACYLAGSIPFGAILGRLHGVDLRKAGSGNVGATNVGRVLGRRWGYLCFFLDVFKGLLPVAAIGVFLGRGADAVAQAAWLLAAMAAIFGHIFPVWLRFKGGKGVATALGVVLGVYPFFTWAGLAAFGLWIAVTLVSRYVSLGSIVAATAFLPFFVAFNWPELAHLWPLGLFAAAMAAVIVVRHRGNIRRLLAGTENKIGKRA